ncbi:MAG: GMC family oxidoreductase N-terminal domain-containing protein [Solirubrobacterales bacterium]
MGDGATAAARRAAQLSESKELTSQERRMRWILRVSAVIFGAETLLYLLPALVGGSEQTWGEVPFVANSWVKSGLFGGLCAIAAADVRRYDRVVSLIVAGLAFWVPAGLAILIWGDTSKTVDLAGFELGMTAIVWGGIVFEGSLALGFALLHRSAYRAWHGIEYLSSGQFRALSAVAEALLWTTPGGRAADEPPPALSPDQIAANTDGYLRAFDAKRKWVMKLALVGINVYPLLFIRQPFTLMAADERRAFLERRFGDDVARRRIGSTRRWLVQGMVRIAQQAVYLGYYSDPATWTRVGYVPFSERPEGRGVQRKRRGELAVESAERGNGDLEAQVVIVGSGAAGAMIGYRLAEKGHEVLVLERGSHVEPADFTEDEVEMLATLYRDGALQLTRDFRLQVLQGMCVGGTTVVNNAVSIAPPPEVLAEWERRAGGGFDPGRITGAVPKVQKLLSIDTQPSDILQPGARKFVEGIAALDLAPQARRYETVAANIHECLGCGYCNIGCAYGRKLSALDTLLPWAQQQPHGSLRIVADVSAEGIEERDGVVEAVHCRANGRRFRVRGKRFVVAAGAINSSYLLGRSGLGGPRVGRDLSFNIGSPITADFDEELRSYAGLQITHVFEPPADGPEVVMETWFNPVLSQSVAMPGWFDQHRRNMLRYANMTATGVLVGTAPDGRVEKALFGGPDVVYRPSAADLQLLVDGLKLAGRIYLAAGAKRVMPATFAYHSFTAPEQLDQLDGIVRDNEDIQLGTGHPQGGNPLGARAEHGPVDPRDFRVHGTENLHVCDASVFPTSVRVNPQLTVLALAWCAADEIHNALA